MGGRFTLRRICAYPGCTASWCYRTLQKWGDGSALGAPAPIYKKWCETCEKAYSHCTSCNEHGCTQYNCNS